MCVACDLDKSKLSLEILEMNALLSNGTDKHLASNYRVIAFDSLIIGVGGVALRESNKFAYLRL